MPVTVIKCKAPSTSFNAFHSRLSIHSLVPLQITGKYVSFRVLRLLKLCSSFVEADIDCFGEDDFDCLLMLTLIVLQVSLR